MHRTRGDVSDALSRDSLRARARPRSAGQTHTLVAPSTALGALRAPLPQPWPGPPPPLSSSATLPACRCRQGGASVSSRALSSKAGHTTTCRLAAQTAAGRATSTQGSTRYAHAEARALRVRFTARGAALFAVGLVTASRAEEVGEDLRLCEQESELVLGGSSLGSAGGASKATRSRGHAAPRPRTPSALIVAFCASRIRSSSSSWRCFSSRSRRCSARATSRLVFVLGCCQPKGKQESCQVGV